MICPLLGLRSEENQSLLQSSELDLGNFFTSKMEEAKFNQFPLVSPKDAINVEQLKFNFLKLKCDFFHVLA